MKPVEDGLFTIPETDDEEPRLIGGKCPECDEVFFPNKARCDLCGGELESTHLSNEGEVWSCSSIVYETRTPPGYEGELPYAFGWVELPEGITIMSRLTGFDYDDPLEVGTPVRLTLEELKRDEDGEPVVFFSFEPTAEAEVEVPQ